MRNRIMLAATLLASLLCVGFARQAPESRARWEYRKACTLPDLNRLGEEGWELVKVTQDGHIDCFYLKRQK